MSPERIGKVVRALREARGLTQVELARKAKIAQPYIAMLERGDRKNPSLPVLRRIAKALDAPVEELLSGRLPMSGAQAVNLIFERLCAEAKARGRDAAVRADVLEKELDIPHRTFVDAVEGVREASANLYIALTGPDLRSLKLGTSWLGRCEDKLGKLLK